MTACMEAAKGVEVGYIPTTPVPANFVRPVSGRLIPGIWSGCFNAAKKSECDGSGNRVADGSIADACSPDDLFIRDGDRFVDEISIAINPAKLLPQNIPDDANDTSVVALGKAHVVKLIGAIEKVGSDGFKAIEGVGRR